MVIQSDLNLELIPFVSEQQHPNNNKTYHLTPYIMYQLYQKSIKLNIGIRL